MSVTTDENSHGSVTLTPEFLSVEDASAVLRISEREIHRLINEGELTTYPYKRRKLVDPESVHALADRIRSGAFAKETAE